MNSNPSMHDVERQRVLQALTALENGGGLTPAAVVEAARDPVHTLHHYFDWDDAHAAESYRLVQARGLIRSVKLDIVRMNADPRELKIRAYESRQGNRGARGGGYEPIADILRDPDKRRDMILTALNELGAIRRRYARLQELNDIWAALDEVIDHTSEDSPPATAPTDGEPRQGAAGA